MSGYRPPYTRNEQNKIVQYIVQKKGYYQLRGRQFWQEMEKDGVANRTWQSMKEHFIKQILPSLHSQIFDISDEEVMKIRQGFTQTATGYKARHYEQDNSPDFFNMEDSD